jgi:hypothetical protein
MSSIQFTAAPSQADWQVLAKLVVVKLAKADIEGEKLGQLANIISKPSFLGKRI